MFERYTEKARRVIFFARYECSALGSSTVKTEHLLLGLLRESPAIVSIHLKVHASKLVALATRLRSLSITSQPIATSVDLPLHDDSKRVLGYAAEEAQGMGHEFIGTEHLLLGVMRVERGDAAEVLRAIGTPELAEVRKSISESAAKGEGRSGSGSGSERHSSLMKLVEEKTGRKLAASIPFAGVPRIGDAVQLIGSGEDAGGYRVVDVRWGIRLWEQGEGAVLSGVEIRVRREEPDNG
jgi:ATP-dependent Clp protease ATP-binding subunit ClpC